MIVGDHEAVDPLDERLGLLRAEVEHLEPAGKILMAAAPMRTGDGHQRPHDLVAGNAGNLVESTFRYRERGDASPCLDALAGWATDLIGAPTIFLIGGFSTIALALIGLSHPAIRSLD